jgi:hypothetical protein
MIAMEHSFIRDHDAVLYDRLVEVGANKLEAAQDMCHDKNHEREAQYLTAYYALAEAASSMFKVDSHKFQKDCMAVIITREETTRDEIEEELAEALARKHL